MKDKAKKAKMQVTAFVLVLTVLFLAELFTMMQFANFYVLIVILGVLIMGCVLMIVQGLFTIREQKDLRREEQYDSIFKSEKASYLMLKKHFEEIEEQLIVLQESSQIPTEEIINAQKGIAKVIISRSRENAEATMNSNDLMMEEVTSFSELLSKNNDALLTSQQLMMEEKIKELVQKQNDIQIAMKDMELRLNSVIMQNPSAASASTPMVEAPVVEEPMEVPVEEVPVEEVPVVETPIEDIALEEVAMEEPVVEETPVEEVLLDEAPAEEIPMEDAFVEDIAVEDVAEEIPLEEISEDEVLAEETLSVGDELEEALEDTIMMDSIKEVEEVAVEAPAEELPPMPDLSDPNKKMDSDDIAALIANMTAADVTAPEETQIEAPAEEIPPMPDLSDPNKPMSSEDIAALIANM